MAVGLIHLNPRDTFRYTNGLLHNLAAFVIATIKLLLVLVWFPLLFYWENMMATFIGSCVVWVANGITMIFYAGTFSIISRSN